MKVLVAYATKYGATEGIATPGDLLAAIQTDCGAAFRRSVSPMLT